MAIKSTDIPSRTAGANRFHYWANPTPDDIGATSAEFLHLLPGPTHIYIAGKNPQRARAIVTLSHGNEPSGLQAIFEVLKRQIEPVVDIHCFIPSVDAAKQAPGFIYRTLPHHRDFNRCFKPPFDIDEQGQLALELLQSLQAIAPECLIDIHNTSGSSPPFGVTSFMSARHNALVSLFTHRTIVTDLRLGSLMEISESFLPTVTIECGGALDTESANVAFEGLQRYFTLDDVLRGGYSDLLLEFFHNPIRMELQEGSDIAYGDHCLFEGGVTLLPDIENHNFGTVDASCRLGFVSGELTSVLTAKDAEGEERVSDFFEVRAGELFPTRELKLFMVTTNPEIARKDCLFYLVAQDPSPD